MKIVILAAGYGTRMQGIIGDMPKALVEVGGRTILDLLMANLDACSDESDRVIVTNARFYDQFAAWQAASGRDVVLLNDGSTEAENRLGAVADIRFALIRAGIEEDTMVVAADNIFDFDLGLMVSAFSESGGRDPLVAIRHNPDMEDQKRRGVVEVDKERRILAFAEKPERPTTRWAAAPLYIFPDEVLGLLDEFVAKGGNIDAPGHFIAYMVRQYPVFGWEMPGRILDVGNPASLAQARDAKGGVSDE